MKREYILPIKLDSTKLPGLTATTGFIDGEVTSVGDIVRFIGKKLGVKISNTSKVLEGAWDRQFVVYQGARMTSYWPIKIREAQRSKTLTFLSTLDRIPYGKERRFGRGRLPKNCHDCGVLSGQLHVLSCHMEECANCRGQLIACGCKTTDDDPALVEA